MKKSFSVILALVILLLCVSASANAVWSFPISMMDLDERYIILVNTDHPLGEKDVPSSLIKVKGIKRATSAEIQLQDFAAEALIAFFEEAATVTEYTYTDAKGKEQTATYAEGMTLYLKSGYRSYGTQKTVYANHLASTNGKDDGYVQKPGASEHQTGLCADILNASFSRKPKMTQDFQYTPEAQWMRENCARFGFILRYTEDEETTGIAYEPWHFRYVGVSVATYIMEQGITLEEFTEEYNAAMENFIAEGGNVEEQIALEQKYANTLPDSFVLEEYQDEDGDCEVTLEF